MKAARARGISVSLNNENESQNAPSEINVIGYNVDDATREVEKFVDRAFLAGLPRVRVVHGSGMGILRKALRQALQQHPHVESVAEPPQNEGGGGATVVELRVYSLIILERRNVVQRNDVSAVEGSPFAVSALAGTVTHRQPRRQHRQPNPVLCVRILPMTFFPL